MLPLRDLQARFMRSIARTPGPSAFQGFDPHLVDLVRSDSPLGAANHLDIYAQMYWARLVDVLRDDFPRVAAILGTQRFATLACAYLAQHPSTRPSVRWVGARFAEFLAGNGSVERMPFLADLARLEWTRLAAFDAADVVPLRLEELRAIPPATWPGLTLRAIPALHVLRLAWPVHELCAGDDPEAPATVVRPAETVLRVWRDRFTVYHARVDRVEDMALEQLGRGTPFAAMCERLEASLPAVDAAREAAALVLRWVEDGILAGHRG